MRPSYSWVIPIAGFWPLVAFGVTFLRFGELPGDGEQVAAAVLGFLLVGVLSGLVLISLLRRTATRSTSAFVVGGYLLAAPFGYVLGIMGPLSLEALGAGWLPRSMDYLLLFPLTVGFYGSLPPVCGAVIGFLIDYIINRGS
jgi:NhaP-type Na+/H+ or K+/H+ antiporter